MPHVKIKVPLYKAGVRTHNTGEVVELSDEASRTYVRRGWGEVVQPRSAEDGAGGKPQKGNTGKGGEK